VRTPLGYGEEFIIPEMVELIRQKHNLLIVPRSPSKCRIFSKDAIEISDKCIYQPILSLKILCVFFIEFIRHFNKCISILYRIISSSGKILNILKNLIVFPKALWLARLAKEWHADHLHAHWALTTSTMAMIVGEISGIPWSFTAHRGDIVDNNLFEIKTQKACFVRFISQSGFQMAQAIYGNSIKGQTHIIHMGVQIASYPHNLSQLPDIPVIFCPANLLPVKGHVYLIEAIAILKNRGVPCLLKLAGKGPLRNKIEEQVKNMRIAECVEFLGHIPHDKLLKTYSEGMVSMIVLPSIDMGNNEHEGIPVCLMEAMSFGIPCISTTTGGISELIGNGGGILVTPMDSHALSDAIQMLLQDYHIRIETAKKGFMRVKDEFNIENVVGEIASLMASYKLSSDCFNKI
jgi:glycosyltransferase involved in cell wall biosynthesis